MVAQAASGFGLSLNASLVYDSDLDAVSDGRSDWYQRGGVTLDYNRHGTLLDMEMSTSMSYNSYSRFKGENGYEPNLTLALSRSRGRIKSLFDFSYRRGSETSSESNARARSEHLGGNVGFRVPISGKTTVSVNSKFGQIRYFDHQDTLRDSRAASTSVNGLFRINEARSVTVGVFRSKSDAGVSTMKSAGVSAGLSGRLTSKLSGRAGLGLSSQATDYRHSGQARYSSSDISTDIDITFAPNKRHSLQLAVNRSYSTLADGGTALNTAMRLSLDGRVRRVGYSVFVVSNRLDRIGVGTPVGVNYGVAFDCPIGQRFSARLSYDINKWSGTSEDSSFVRSLFSLSLSMRI